VTYFQADGDEIRREFIRRDNAGVEVAVGALRLAKRHLDVNAQIIH
jgi:hypothetical protein